jgi:hypothetical protein
MWLAQGLIAALVFVALGSGAALGDHGRERGDRGGREPSHRPVARFLDDVLPDGAGGTLVAARGGELLHCRGFGLADRGARVAAGCDTSTT